MVLYVIGWKSSIKVLDYVTDLTWVIAKDIMLKLVLSFLSLRYNS